MFSYQAPLRLLAFTGKVLHQSEFPISFLSFSLFYFFFLKIDFRRFCISAYILLLFQGTRFQGFIELFASGGEKAE